MLSEQNTRRVSRAAKRQHSRVQAEQHGWAHSALPLRVSLEDMLRSKAERDDELGDRADAALAAAGLA